MFAHIKASIDDENVLIARECQKVFSHFTGIKANEINVLYPNFDADSIRIFKQNFLCVKRMLLALAQ